MKKFTKVCLTFSIVLLILGTGISAAAAAMGATWRDLPSIGHSWDYYEEVYDTFSSEYDSMFWADEVCQEFSEVARLNIEVNAGEIQVVKNDNIENILVKVRNAEYKMNMEGEKLNVTLYHNNKNRLWEFEDYIPRIQIEVPMDYEFDKVDIEVKAGAFYAEELNANELDIELKAGAVDIKHGEVERLNGECKAGEIVYRGYVTDRVKADCKAGNIELRIIGEKENYNYNIGVSAGSVEIGGYDYAGLKSSKRISNPDATGSMDLTCKAGNIEVIFYDEF